MDQRNCLVSYHSENMAERHQHHGVIMIALAQRIRKVAEIIKNEQYHLEEVKIFFSAPNPRKPGSDTITIDKDKAKEANFQWLVYQILFSVDEGRDEPKYFIYSVGLEPTGKEKLPNKVFESDSNWSGKNKDNPTKDMTPGDVKRAFPETLKGPNLNPIKSAQTVYVNTDESDKAHVYSSEDFRRFFDNDFYVVLNPQSRELRNPFGKPIGMSYKKAFEGDPEVLETLANASPTDAFHTCRVCGQKYASQCKCRYSDMSCPSGHRWSICPVHKKRVEGVTGHELNLGWDVCTCKYGKD